MISLTSLHISEVVSPGFGSVYSVLTMRLTGKSVKCEAAAVAVAVAATDQGQCENCQKLTGGGSAARSEAQFEI